MAEQFSMKRFADEPHLWHNTSSKIDECADSAPKGWVFSKRIGVFGDSIRLESILVYSFRAQVYIVSNGRGILLSRLWLTIALFFALAAPLLHQLIRMAGNPAILTDAQRSLSIIESR